MRAPLADAGSKVSQISSASVTTASDYQVEPKRNVISGAPVLQVAEARMCRTSACRAGFLLRRSCRQEKAHVSSFDIARFQRKRGMPLLCCPELTLRARFHPASEIRLQTRT